MNAMQMMEDAGEAALRFGAVEYFVDLRREEFRNIRNSLDCVAFASVRGQRMCEEAGIVCCPHCQHHGRPSDAPFCTRCRGELELI